MIENVRITWARALVVAFVVELLQQNPHFDHQGKNDGPHLDSKCKNYVGESPILETCCEMVEAKSPNERIT